MGLALRITRERADAEEVVVDTFAQAWRDASRFEVARGSVGAWLATIARSRSLDLVRSRNRRMRVVDGATSEASSPLENAASDQPSPQAGMELTEQSVHVRNALAALPAAQRQALELAYFDGLSQTDIASRLNEPLGTVKTRMRLGLRKLRESLAVLAPGGAP